MSNYRIGSLVQDLQKLMITDRESADELIRIATRLSSRAERFWGSFYGTGEGRYMLDLPLEPAPEHLLADLTRAGAHLVSLNPVRQTLEDFFVEQVTAPDVLASSRGLDT